MDSSNNHSIVKIITFENVTPSPEIIHFRIADDNGNDYLDIPMDIADISTIISDLWNFTTIHEALENREKLTEETKVLLSLIDELGINSFLVESFNDYSSSFWIEDLLQIVIHEGKIIHEKTVNEEGDLNSDFYGYMDCDKITYSNYEHAKRLFLNK